MSKLTFQLSLEETNLILQALGRMPFQEVHELIHHLQQQATPQLSDSAAAQTTAEPKANPSVTQKSKKA